MIEEGGCQTKKTTKKGFNMKRCFLHNVSMAKSSCGTRTRLFDTIVSQVGDSNHLRLTEEQIKQAEKKKKKITQYEQFEPLSDVGTKWNIEQSYVVNATTPRVKLNCGMTERHVEEWKILDQTKLEYKGLVINDGEGHMAVTQIARDESLKYYPCTKRSNQKMLICELSKLGKQLPRTKRGTAIPMYSTFEGPIRYFVLGDIPQLGCKGRKKTKKNVFNFETKQPVQKMLNATEQMMLQCIPTK